MKTPIFIDLNIELNGLNSNEFDINKEDFFDIRYNPLNAAPPFVPPINTETPRLLAPRYYLLIKSPLDQNLPTLKINIHKSVSSLLKNQARVLLNPSINYGLNSCYTVEYWQWVPNLNLSTEISKRKIKSEKWLVPLLDINYIPQYPYYLYNTEYSNNNIFNDIIYKDNIYNIPRLISDKINVERIISGNTIEDSMLNKKYSNIFCFPKDTYINFNEEIQTEYLDFNNETRAWDFSKYLVKSTLIRKNENIDGDLIDGPTTTTINYIQPFVPSQLIIEDNHI